MCSDPTPKPKPSAERRVTISPTVYPIVEEHAKAGGVTAADVVNAVLLQTFRPYGPVNQVNHQAAPPPVPASTTEAETSAYQDADNLDQW